jgi:hypothetical protein
MSAATSKTFVPAFLKTLGLLWGFILFGLFFDSKYMLQWIDQPQWISNVLMFIGYGIVLWRVSPRLREQMITATIIGIIGEYLLSVGLGMYTYRLGNVPHYVPPGHALMYIGVLFFTKTIYAKQNRAILEKVLTVFAIAYGTAFLIFKNDYFGFILTVATLWVLRNKSRERLFYLTMYLAVAYLEIVGTHYLCWRWPATFLGDWTPLPSANPPSGISFFYFSLDLGCLWLYKQRHKVAWKRMKTIRAIRQQA